MSNSKWYDDQLRIINEKRITAVEDSRNNYEINIKSLENELQEEIKSFKDSLQQKRNKVFSNISKVFAVIGAVFGVGYVCLEQYEYAGSINRFFEIIRSDFFDTISHMLFIGIVESLFFLHLY